MTSKRPAQRELDQIGASRKLLEDLVERRDRALVARFIRASTNEMESSKSNRLRALDVTAQAVTHHDGLR